MEARGKTVAQENESKIHSAKQYFIFHNYQFWSMAFVISKIL